MQAINWILALVPLVLLVTLAVILARKKLYRRFPFFTAYTLYAIAAGLVRTALSAGNPRTYFYVFWATEPIYALLGLAAIYEAFREIFHPFYRIWWFRPLVYLVAVATLGISIARTIHVPPVEVSVLDALILSFELGIRYIQGGIFALTWLLIMFFRLPAPRYAVGIVDGFGVTAIGILVASLLRSDFGTRFNKLFTFVPAVVYILACFIWLAAMRGTESQNGNGGTTPEIPLENMPGQLRRWRDEAKRISRIRRR
jgi:hypothetical protein